MQRSEEGAEASTHYMNKTCRDLVSKFLLHSGVHFYFSSTKELSFTDYKISNSNATFGFSKGPLVNATSPTAIYSYAARAAVGLAFFFMP